ncbi:replication factor A protein 1-like [Rutidosis leptorrhynchoides]|uniref:replication factor A protein 1-like n=1 Tax=Rutidosis leptorrhynchoides TaxID=125765 RepID=UPI003A98FBC3
MAEGRSTTTSEVKTKKYVLLSELELGKPSQVKVMICRSWDTYTVHGKYLSTEFIASDEQLTARSNIAHHFIARLKDGCIFLLNDFDVIANRAEYRIMRDNHLMIKLNGSTFMRKQPTGDSTGFIRHPFSCIEIENLEPTLGKFLVDVVGYAANVGEPEPTKKGSTTLEFDLVNERGKAIHATLWGSLGSAFCERQAANPGLYFIILSSVTVRNGFNNTLNLSSTSATLIIDDVEIPTLKNFREKMSAIEGPVIVDPSSPAWQLPPPQKGTLRDLLDMARRGKKNITADVFKCQVEIVNIRWKKLWYYNTCSVCKARKGLSRMSGQHWCESCQDIVPEPITRFRIICDVRDETAETVMVLFDEPAEEVTQATAKILLNEIDEETCNTVLPNAIANLLNTTWVVLLKATSYYEHGPFESFNCVKVYAPEPVHANPPLAAAIQPNISTDSSPSTTVLASSSSTPKGQKRTIEVPTPAKDLERGSHRRFVVASESEDEDALGTENKDVNECVCPQ